MTETGYEAFDHTADLGLRAQGGDRAEVYLNAARGMLSLVVDPETIRPGRERELAVEGDDRVELLFEFLREILYQFNVAEVIWQPQRVKTVSENRLAAVVSEDPIAPDRHRLRHEIKAVTLHGMTVEQTDGGWTAEAIFDV